MNTNAIATSWNGLAGRRVDFVQDFYGRLFDRHPEYRRLFPDRLDAQAEHMVEVWSTVARFADHIDIVRPYLLRVGEAHRSLGLGRADLERFKQVFLECMAEACGEEWDDATAAAWDQAFGNVIVPIVEEGLERPTRA